jgi:hypothetical protein
MPSSAPALILDRLVADWLHANADIFFNLVPWDSASYDRYLRLMNGWAEKMGATSDELETCIFMDQASRSGSQWG